MGIEAVLLGMGVGKSWCEVGPGGQLLQQDPDFSKT